MCENKPKIFQTQMKSIYPLVLTGAKNMVDFINKKIACNKTEIFDARDIGARFTCEVTTSSVFGFDAKAFSTEDSEIFELGKSMMKGISESNQSFFPKKLIPKYLEDRFINFMTTAMKQRLEDNSARDDFLSHIIAVKRKNNQSDEEAAANGWTIYLDASETSGIVAHYALYELASNERVQDKLREEIMDNLNDDGILPFESLNELQYLDQVFYEVLRLHPPFMFTTKVCSEEIELEGVKGHKVVMKKGSTAMICMHSIQLDPGEFFLQVFRILY